MMFMTMIDTAKDAMFSFPVEPTLVPNVYRVLIEGIGIDAIQIATDITVGFEPGDKTTYKGDYRVIYDQDTHILSIGEL